MVNVGARLHLAQERGIDARVAQLVFYLTYLYQEVLPSLFVIGEQVAFAVFLCHRQISTAVRVLPALEIAEVGFAQELMSACIGFFESLSCEDVLFVQGIALAECLGKGGEQPGVFVVAVNVGRKLLHWVLNTQDGRVFPGLGIEDSNAVHVLYGEIDVAEDPLALASCSEGMDGDCHTR